MDVRLGGGCGFGEGLTSFAFFGFLEFVRGGCAQWFHGVVVVAKWVGAVGGWYVYWFILFAGGGGIVMFVGGRDGLRTHFHVPSCWLVSLLSLSFPSVFSVFVLGWLCYVKWEVPGVSFFFFFFFVSFGSMCAVVLLPLLCLTWFH